MKKILLSISPLRFRSPDQRLFLFLIPVIFLCSVICLHAQTYTWEKIYNQTYYDDARCNTSIFNNDYYYVGGRSGAVQSCILKINSRTGEILWSKLFGNTSEQGMALAITLTPDGGCIFSGIRGNCFAIRLDPNGNTVWDKSYPIGSDYIRSINLLSDGNFLMCGDYGTIIKIDSNGNSIWIKVHNMSGYTNYKSSVEVNHNYFLAGNIQPEEKFLLTKLDSSGNILRDTTYNFLNHLCLAGNISFSSNSILLTGSYANGFYRVKLSLEGSVLSEKSINVLSRETYTRSKYFEGNFYFLSQIISLNNDSIYNRILITDSLGNELRSKLLRKYQEYEVNDFSITDKYNFILTGNELNDGLNGDNFYFARFDSLLNVSVKSNYSVVSDFTLHQNYPNPFNPSTKITYSLKKSSAIELKLFDINGRLIKIIESGFKPAGTYEINFSAEGLSSGVYFFSLYSEGIIIDTKKGVIVK